MESTKSSMDQNKKAYRMYFENALKERHNLDDAMLKSFKITIKSLLKRKLPICFQTVDVYNDLLEKTMVK